MKFLLRADYLLISWTWEGWGNVSVSLSVLTMLFFVVLGVVKLETELTELQTQLTKSTSELENLKSEAVKNVEAVKAENAAETKKMQESTKQQVE